MLSLITRCGNESGDAEAAQQQNAGADDAAPMAGSEVLGLLEPAVRKRVQSRRSDRVPPLTGGSP
jgi:hypothetical protein